jgi:hypothetical protein
LFLDCHNANIDCRRLSAFTKVAGERAGESPALPWMQPVTVRKAFGMQQIKSAFDCYWQGDISRSHTGVHFGLGLAMVKRMVELLGGKIRAEAPNGLFSIHVCLPIAKDSL